MTIRITILLLCVSIGLTSAEALDNINVDTEIGVTLASSYAWRGRMVRDKAMVQPEINISLQRVNINFWGTWDIDSDEVDTSERTRVDSSIDYGFMLGAVQMKAGLVVHAWHDEPVLGTRDTYETYVDMVATEWPMYPSLVIYHDFGTIQGYYGALSIMEGREITDKISADLKMSIGAGSESFNEKWFSASNPTIGTTEPSSTGTSPSAKAALVDLTASVEFPMELRDGWSIVPKVEYVTLLDPDLRSAARAAGLDPDNLALSVTLAFVF
jgi:hypothetical protein